MSFSVIGPAPDQNDIFDVGNIQASVGANGKVTFAPGSFRPSAAWRIWFDSQFVVDQSTIGLEILEALDEGAADNSALRSAADALTADAVSVGGMDRSATIRQQALSLALQDNSPDCSRRIRNIELLMASMAEAQSCEAIARQLQRSIETQGEPSQRNWSVVSGTHAARLLTPAGGQYLNRVFFETDRNAVYVSIANVWTLAVAFMVNLATNRPIDLVATDVNFQFLASDTLAQSYWSGAAWVPFGAGGGTSGSFTPVLAFGGSSTGIVYAVNAGVYWTDAGGMVHATLQVALTSKGAQTGVATISGLPSNSGAQWQASIEAIGMLALTGAMSANVQNGTGIIQINQWGATGVAALTNAFFTNTSSLIISFQYHP